MPRVFVSYGGMPRDKGMLFLKDRAEYLVGQEGGWMLFFDG